MLGKTLISSVLIQIPVFILGVAGGILSTRILGEEAKGAFSLFQANTQLFVLIFSIGIQTGIVYFVSSKKIDQDKVAGMAVYIFFISSSILIFVLLFLQFFGFSEILIPRGFNTSFNIVILFAMFLLTFYNTIISSFLQAHSRFKTINKVSLANGIINTFIFCIAFAFTFNSTQDPLLKFNIVLYSTLLSLAINSLLWIFFSRKEIVLKPDFNFKLKNEVKNFISYNILIYLGMFINFFNYRLDLWVINNYLSEKELSYYSLAANINQILLYAAVTISSILLPNLSGKNEEERISTFIKISRICFCLFFGVIIIAYFVSPFIIPFVYGKVFEPAVFPFQILLPGMLFSCITQIFSIFIVSIHRNIFNIIACFIGLVCTVILDLILIPRFGINGASIATTITYFSIFIFTYIFVMNIVRINTFNLFIPLKTDMQYIQNNILKSAKA